MTKNVDFNKYSHFVDAVTSDCSKDFVSLAAVSYTHLTLPTTPYV